MNKQYIQLIDDLKKRIIQSRYAAARLANKEQLLLYFNTGKILSEKIAAKKWGSKILERISADLQKGLPGLRGFSYRNLMKMNQFAKEYKSSGILPSVTAEIRMVRRRIGKNQVVENHFYSISFSHHILTLNRCKTVEEYFIFLRLPLNSGLYPFWNTILKESYSLIKVNCRTTLRKPYRKN